MNETTGIFHDRRLARTVGRVVCGMMLPLSFLAAQAQETDIWEGTPTGKVVMTSYLLPGENHPAVIICPGGSYLFHDMHGEGEEVAQWLNRNGISAFVLKYRTASSVVFFTPFRYLIRNKCYPRPQQDLLQALGQVRSSAARWGIDKDRVGVMGFSAGGHLAMTAAECPDAGARPDFVALIYPVVTMSGPYVHKRSRRALLGLGGQYDAAWQDSLSLEKHVPKDCPPVFMVQCKDDPTVHYRNAVLLDSALTVAGVPHRFVQYATGGHGFGASGIPEESESARWKEAFLAWLEGEKTVAAPVR